MSVTGFDNVKFSEFCYPALTTVHIPRDRIGHIIFERLAPKAEKGDSPVENEILIDPEFVVARFHRARAGHDLRNATPNFAAAP